MADYQDKRIQIKTNIPGLKNKIQTRLGGDTDNIFWYIKFNIPLDETSVSEKSMNVSDADGYLMRTEIAYDNRRHLIVISPLDTYEQGVFYMLRISTKVKSKRGNNLKSKMYILFKLTDNQISEFKTLKSNVQIPDIKKRPKNYDAMFKEKIQTMSRLYSFNETPFKEERRDKLPSAPVKVNIWLGVGGLLVLVVFIITRNIVILEAGLLICAVGITHIIIQLSKNAVRSVFAYNKGVRRFNKERYTEAAACFKKAAALDTHNEMAEYAVNKMTFYK